MTIRLSRWRWGQVLSLQRLSETNWIIHNPLTRSLLSPLQIMIDHGLSAPLSGPGVKGRPLACPGGEGLLTPARPLARPWGEAHASVPRPLAGPGAEKCKLVSFNLHLQGFNKKDLLTFNFRKWSFLWINCAWFMIYICVAGRGKALIHLSIFGEFLHQFVRI